MCIRDSCGALSGVGRKNRELVQEWAAHWPATGDINRWATHVDAVVDLFSDPGSIPGASIKRNGPAFGGAVSFELSASSHQPSAITSNGVSRRRRLPTQLE